MAVEAEHEAGVVVAEQLGDGVNREAGGEPEGSRGVAQIMESGQRQNEAGRRCGLRPSAGPVPAGFWGLASGNGFSRRPGW